MKATIEKVLPQCEAKALKSFSPKDGEVFEHSNGYFFVLNDGKVVMLNHGQLSVCAGVASGICSACRKVQAGTITLTLEHQ